MGEKSIELGIHALVDRRLQRTAVDRRGCRYGNFRHVRRVRLHEFEMLDHRMGGKSQLAGDPHSLVARSDAGKCNAGIHDVALDAIKPPEKIEVPPGATKLTVSYCLKPYLLLFLAVPLILTVFDLLEIRTHQLPHSSFLSRCVPPLDAAQ